MSSPRKRSVLERKPHVRDLERLQRTFHAIATGAAPLDVAAELVEHRPERVEIYRRMYRDRLVDAIADDYPKLVALLGERWLATATAYLRDCPPSDPDIHRAGRRLAAFLSRIAAVWERDLALLEWARAEVFFGADATPLARHDLAELDAADFPTLPLRLVPASAFVELASNADDLWSAVEEGLVPPAVETTSRAVMVWRRRSLTVVHRTLDADEVPCVRLLVDGTQFSDLCEAVADAADPAARAIELLLRWIDAEMLDASALASASDGVNGG
jgi:hypothetical protein